MRMILRVLAWIFALAAVTRGAITFYGVWLAATLDTVAWDISAEDLITDHLGIIDFAPDLARSILPDHFVQTILVQPALVITPLAAVVAAALSWLFFKMSR